MGRIYVFIILRVFVFVYVRCGAQAVASRRGGRYPLLHSATFIGLVGQHVFGMLLVTGPCSTFVLRSSNQIRRGVFSRCMGLNLHCPPHFCRITSRRRTRNRLTGASFSLVVYVPNASGGSIFSVTHKVGARGPAVPVIILAPFDRNVHGDVRGVSFSVFSCIFY